MTQETTGKTEVQLTDDEKREQAVTEQKEAEAGFSAGFGKVSGEKPAAAKSDDAPSTPEKSDAEKEAEALVAEQAEKDKQAQVEAAATAKAEADVKAKAESERKFVEGLPSRLRNIEGHLGGLNSKLDTALATAKAAAENKGGEAPTETQVQAAISDPEAWKKLKEDFPDWAGPVEAEFAAVRKELAKVSKSVDVEGLKTEVKGQVDTAITQGLEAAEERAFTRMKHPDWKGTVKTAEFKSWLGAQPDDVKALSGSNSGDDAVKLLDKYAEHRGQLASSEEARLKKEKRLKAAVVPQGGGGEPTTTGISDEEAFARGFKREAAK